MFPVEKSTPTVYYVATTVICNRQSRLVLAKRTSIGVFSPKKKAAVTGLP